MTNFTSKLLDCFEVTVFYDKIIDKFSVKLVDNIFIGRPGFMW